LLKLLRAATQHLICQHTVAEPERKPNLPKFESVIQFNLDLPNLLFYLHPCKPQVRTLTGIPALYLIFQQYQCLPCIQQLPAGHGSDLWSVSSYVLQ